VGKDMPIYGKYVVAEICSVMAQSNIVKRKSKGGEFIALGRAEIESMKQNELIGSHKYLIGGIPSLWLLLMFIVNDPLNCFGVYQNLPRVLIILAVEIQLDI
jgi:hypothetical protein